MSYTQIPEPVSRLLWGRAAGRCHICNKPLWRDDELTKIPMNAGDRAHIIGDGEDGPRSDPELSKQLAKDITNLMLLCKTHHRMVDHELKHEYPAERLRAIKREHEARIELVTGIAEDRTSHVLMYGANVGAQHPFLSFQRASPALLPDRYPATTTPFEMSLVNSLVEDREESFWRQNDDHLTRQFEAKIRPALLERRVNHLSVFAVAPQPLLTRLGSLLTDIPAADVFQLHREPPTWNWKSDDGDSIALVVERPETRTGPPALVLALSATVNGDRINSALGGEATIFRITVATPGRDVIRTRRDLMKVREALRTTLDEIKATHGESALLHVFPAAPVSAAIELGRVHQPKADLEALIYDQVAARGGFVPALRIGTSRPGREEEEE